jgi:prepilin-type N-terminal cleavage/methylation domain-containing protein
LHRLRARHTSEHGFTLIELFMVMMIIAVVCTIALGVTPRVVRSMKGGSVASELSAFLRVSREDAISRRRLIRMVATAPNKVESFVINPTDGTAGLLRTMYLSGSMSFRQFSGQGDTGDTFGATSEITFSGSGPHSFTSEGMFVDANGDPSNGTIFIGQENMPNTAAAVTILGATAGINAWRYNGTAWVQ